jgi:hypothetical protein
MYETLSSLRTVQTEFFSANKDERVGAIHAADSIGRASELYNVDRGTRWQDAACHRSSWRLEVEFDGATYGGDSVELGRSIFDWVPVVHSESTVNDHARIDATITKQGIGSK